MHQSNGGGASGSNDQQRRNTTTSKSPALRQSQDQNNNNAIKTNGNKQRQEGAVQAFKIANDAASYLNGNLVDVDP